MRSKKDNVTGLSNGNKCNQNFHSLGVGLHVDTTAHLSSSKCLDPPTEAQPRSWSYE